MPEQSSTSDYDARRIVLDSRGSPDHTWHPAGLLSILVAASTSWRLQRISRFNSLLQRDVFAKMAAAQLYETGFNVDEILKSALRPNIVGEFVRVSARAAFRFARGEDVESELREVGSWFLGVIGSPSENADFNSYYGSAAARIADSEHAMRVAGWVQRASVLDLLTWNLPTEEELISSDLCHPYAPPSESQWMCDRFLLTYLEDWHTDSLHQEYHFVAGEDVPAGVPSEVCALRRVDHHDLNAVIAKRAVTTDIEDPRALLSTAVASLRTGEIERAVALFQGALAVRQSKWVRNGLAFCLVPTDVDAAHAMFEQLLADGFNTPLVRANLAATCRLRGDVSQAKSHAKIGLSELGSETGDSAFLWNVEGVTPVLIENVSVGDYLRFVLGWS